MLNSVAKTVAKHRLITNNGKRLVRMIVPPEPIAVTISLCTTNISPIWICLFDLVSKRGCWVSQAAAAGDLKSWQVRSNPICNGHETRVKSLNGYPTNYLNFKLAIKFLCQARGLQLCVSCCNGNEYLKK
jgi:hypothetical protein